MRTMRSRVCNAARSRPVVFSATFAGAIPGAALLALAATFPGPELEQANEANANRAAETDRRRSMKRLFPRLTRDARVVERASPSRLAWPHLARLASPSEIADAWKAVRARAVCRERDRRELKLRGRS